jgi:hypothetical protein
MDITHNGQNYVLFFFHQIDYVHDDAHYLPNILKSKEGFPGKCGIYADFCRNILDGEFKGGGMGVDANVTGRASQTDSLCMWLRWG